MRKRESHNLCLCCTFVKVVVTYTHFPLDSRELKDVLCVLHIERQRQKHIKTHRQLQMAGKNGNFTQLHRKKEKRKIKARHVTQHACNIIMFYSYIFLLEVCVEYMEATQLVKQRIV